MLAADPQGYIGAGYIVQDIGNLYIWNGASYSNIGPIRGDIGYTGSAGAGGSGPELYVIERSSTDTWYTITTPATPSVGQTWKVVIEPWYGRPVGNGSGGLLRVGFNNNWGGNYTLFGHIGVIWGFTDQSYHGEAYYPSSGYAYNLIFDNRGGWDGTPETNADFCRAAQIDLVYMGNYSGVAWVSISGFKVINGYTP